MRNLALPGAGWVTFGINLTFLGDILSTDRCQNELNDPEFSSAILNDRLVC